MPCLTPKTRPWVLEWLVLQAGCRDANDLPIGEQLFFVCGDEMCHGPAFPHMAMHPQATIHGVNHPLTPTLELSIWLRLRGTTY